VPPNRKLPAELTAPHWEFDEKQRKHVEKKDKLRQRLGRSTDRADACILCTHEPRSVEKRAAVEDDDGPTAAADSVYAGGGDPYAGAMNPYGG
jgi:hypothetical protein